MSDAHLVLTGWQALSIPVGVIAFALAGFAWGRMYERGKWQRRERQFWRDADRDTRDDVADTPED